MNNPVAKAQELRRNLGYERALSICAVSFERALQARRNRAEENLERAKLGKPALPEIPMSLPLFWRNAFGYLKNRP